jgi:hypothetical protein
VTQKDVKLELQRINMIKAFDPSEAEERLDALRQRVTNYIRSQNLNKSIAAILEKELSFFSL